MVEKVWLLVLDEICACIMSMICDQELVKQQPSCSAIILQTDTVLLDNGETPATCLSPIFNDNASKRTV